MREGGHARCHHASTLTVDGADARVPALDPRRPTTRRARSPLILNFHGLGSNKEQQALYTGMNQQGGPGGLRGDHARRAPATVLRHWSFRRSPARRPDVAFVKAMLATTARARSASIRSACTSTGMSNGAIFATLLACALPGRLAAIAPVAGVNATKVCSRGHAARVACSRSTAPPIRSCRTPAALLLGTADRVARSACPRRSRSTTRSRRGPRSTAAALRPRPSSSPTTCSASALARLPDSAARSSSTGSWAVATRGRAPFAVRVRSSRPDHRVDRRHRPDARLLRRPPPPTARGCVADGVYAVR